MKFIDLGLPSGTLWADCNIGAVSPESYGNYYTWNNLDLDEVPTLNEIKELCNKCSWSWTTQNGVNGYKVTGSNGNSIFLPAAGCRYGTSLYDAGSNGFYWSATPYSISSLAYYLYFNSGNYDWYFNYRYYGHTVRPIKRINNLKTNDKMKPITPQQVKQSLEIPNPALAVINKLLIDNYAGIEAVFTKEMLIKELLEAGYNSTTIDSIIGRIPIIYKKYGWDIQETEKGFIFTELLN